MIVIGSELVSSSHGQMALCIHVMSKHTASNHKCFSCVQKEKEKTTLDLLQSVAVEKIFISCLGWSAVLAVV